MLYVTEETNMRVVERDLLALAWIAEQYAVRIDHLQILLARWSRRAEGKEITFRGATKVVERWAKQGWVEYRNIFYGAGNPPWVWLSYNGLRQFGYEFKYLEPKIGTFNHMHAVNTVRLWLEKRYEDKCDWRSERFLWLDYPGLSHYPDAEVLIENNRIAIEVELTQKARSRVKDIVEKLAQSEHGSIWYFVDDSTEKVVRQAAANHKNFSFKNLKEISPHG